MIINFADAYRLQKPDMGNVGGCRHFGKRLLTLLLETQKSGQFHVRVKNEATVDALWICIVCTALGVSYSVVYHIQREASALLVLLWWAMRRSLNA